jgi:hypothetical protein
MLVEELRDPLRHVEARTLVVEPDRVHAEASSASRRPSGDEDRAMTASGWVWSTWAAPTNAMQQRLDRRAWLVGPERAAPQVLDHRRVVHRLARAKRLDLVQPQRGKPTPCDRGEVGARSLDPQDALLPTA